MKLLLFCEGTSDHRTLTLLVDRIIQEEGPPWVRDVFDDYPETVREWMSNATEQFFDLHCVDRYAKRFPRLRLPQGHFNGEPGSAGAQMTRNVIWLVREMQKQDAQISAVLIVWDMDKQGAMRRTGMEQARVAARGLLTFCVVLGCPDAMREAWVLAGFDPVTPAEQNRFDEIRQQLGFSPSIQAHLLGASNEQATRSSKRVLHYLVDDDRERERQCLLDAPMTTLEERGSESGLTSFLAEVRSSLLPLIAPA